MVILTWFNPGGQGGGGGVGEMRLLNKFTDFLEQLRACKTKFVRYSKQTPDRGLFLGGFFSGYVLLSLLAHIFEYFRLLLEKVKHFLYPEKSTKI